MDTETQTITTFTNEAFQRLDESQYLPCFKRFPVTLEKGHGSWVWDVEGNKYLDMLAGIAVNSTGHCHPMLMAAIKGQVEKIMHTSNFYLNRPQANLGKRLTELSGLDRVFFTNSGAESVEGAIKIARKYAHRNGRGGNIISFEHCFHGRTMATIATGKKKMQEGFEPIPTGFQQVPFNDIEAVRNAIDNKTAAIIIEPVQGEGGIHMADKIFMKQLRQLCDEENIVLIFDEIQCGIGRTGKMFAKEHFDVQPDIITLAKALGGGMPIGAILSNEKVSSAITPGDHGTTFGGNAVACAAGLAVLDIIHDENLMDQATQKGIWLRDKFRANGSSDIKEIRGPGLMIGIEFSFETKALVQELLNQGVLANATAGNVLRLVPPLNISYDEMEFFMEAFKKAFNKVKGEA